MTKFFTCLDSFQAMPIEKITSYNELAGVVKAEDVASLKVAYLEANGYTIVAEEDNWYCRWHTPEGKPVGELFANVEDYELGAANAIRI